MIKYCNEHIVNLSNEVFPPLPEDFLEENKTFWFNKRCDFIKQMKICEEILSDMNK